MDTTTALQVLNDDGADRATYRQAAEHLIANPTEVKGPVKITLSGAEVNDPAWKAVVDGTQSGCQCEDEACETKQTRFIVPPIPAIEDGATLVVTAEKTVYLRLAGTTDPLASLRIVPEHKIGAFNVFDRSNRGEGAFELESLNQQLLNIPAEEHNISALLGDGKTPLFRLESADAEALTFTVTLDKNVETCEVRETLEVGETIVVEDKKVFLRLKGAGDNAAVRAYWVAAVPAEDDAAPVYALHYQDHPLNPLAVLMTGGVRRVELGQLAAVLASRPGAGLMRTKNKGVPAPFINIAAVDAEMHTCTIEVDSAFESYTPPEGAAELPSGLSIMMMGPDGKLVTLGGNPIPLEGEEGHEADGDEAAEQGDKGGAPESN